MNNLFITIAASFLVIILRVNFDNVQDPRGGMAGKYLLIAAAIACTGKKFIELNLSFFKIVCLRLILVLREFVVT